MRNLSVFFLFSFFLTLRFHAIAFPYMHKSEFGLDNSSPIPFTFFHSMNETTRLNNYLRIAELCEKTDATYKKLGWYKSPCTELPWKFDYLSEEGHALVYWEFDGTHGSTKAEDKNTTVILGGVHGDELTPVHLVFHLAEKLHNDPTLYQDSRVIIAPIVNPFGFFANPARRTNINKTDLNRNFPTLDWEHGVKLWSKRRDQRKFPGFFPNSEQGTRFQVHLITHYQADKIISIHAPLAFLDLDYEVPGLIQKSNLTSHQQSAFDLAKAVSYSAGNYSIRNFGTYPGSLGNFAGIERKNLTLTIELDSSNPKFVNTYAKNFSPGILHAIKSKFTGKNFSIFN